MKGNVGKCVIRDERFTSNVGLNVGKSTVIIDSDIGLNVGDDVVVEDDVAKDFVGKDVGLNVGLAFRKKKCVI